MNDDQRSARKGKRRPYQQPELKVHGDLKKLTMVKKGKRNDGGGKPRTRASGGRA